MVWLAQKIGWWPSRGSPSSPGRWVVSPVYAGYGPGGALLAMVADGMTVAQIADELPGLEVEDVAGALGFAADALLEWELPGPSRVTVLVGQSPSPLMPRGRSLEGTVAVASVTKDAARRSP